MPKRQIGVSIVVSLLLLQLMLLFTEEGMFPISEIHKLNLATCGLELTADQI